MTELKTYNGVKGNRHGLLSLLLFLLCLSVFGQDPIQYTVKKKDTLGVIAKNHGMDTKQLAAYNGISDPGKIKVGQIIKIPPNHTIHIVKSGETLGLISQKTGISLKTLTSFNSLSRADRIYIGQKLKIPNRETAAPSHPPLTPSLKKQLDAIRITRGKWKYIVIHHSATAKGSLKSFEAYHKRRGMENGLAYHFLIGNGQGTRNGQVEVGSRWKRQIHGGHVKSQQMNHMAIGICLVGNFENTRPSQTQLNVLEALTSYLTTRCGIPARNIRTHTEVNIRPTVCPGKYFPTRSLRAKF